MTTIPYSLNGEIIQLVPLEEYEKLQHELTTAQSDAIYWQQRAAAINEIIKESHSLFQDFSNARPHSNELTAIIQADWIVSKSREALAKLQPHLT